MGMRSIDGSAMCIAALTRLHHALRALHHRMQLLVGGEWDTDIIVEGCCYSQTPALLTNKEPVC